MEFRVERRDPASIGLALDALGPWLDAVGPVAVVDLETTGLAESRSAEILEIGILLLDPGQKTVEEIADRAGQAARSTGHMRDEQRCPGRDVHPDPHQQRGTSVRRCGSDLLAGALARASQLATQGDIEVVEARGDASGVEGDDCSIEVCSGFPNGVGLPDAGYPSQRLCYSCATCHDLGRLLNGADNVLVPGAPAQIPLQPVTNVLRAGLGVLFE